MNFINSSRSLGASQTGFQSITSVQQLFGAPSLLMSLFGFTSTQRRSEHLQFHAAMAPLLRRFAEQILVIPLGFSPRFPPTSLCFISLLANHQP